MDLPKIYPDQQRIVSMLLARVGDDRLASAYFKGDMTPLRRLMDADLGDGAFQRFVRIMRTYDLKAAEAVLR